jgi:hypothetical protein
MEAHSSVTTLVAHFIHYGKSHLPISLTQAGVIGPMRVVACSTTTADKTFMMAGGVATLYPKFTPYSKNMCSEDTQQFHGRENQIGISKSDALALESDTSFQVGGPCGRSCPSLWHSFANYGPYGVFNWDARWDVKQVFVNCDVEWRVHERCVNPHYERDYNKKDRLFWPPSCVVPPMKLT